jgi:hypothetical protein
MEAEQTTDGKTVWINAPVCIGRFCKRSFEIIDVNSCPLYYHCPVTGLPCWESFKEKMYEYHGVRVTVNPPDYLR